MSSKSKISPSSHYHIVAFSLRRDGWMNLIGATDKSLDDCWEDLIEEFPDVQTFKVNVDFFIVRKPKIVKVFLSIKKRKKQLETELEEIEKQLLLVSKIMKNTDE